MKSADFNEEDSRFTSTFVKVIKSYNGSYLTDFKEKIGKSKDAVDCMYLEWRPLSRLNLSYRNHHTPVDVEGLLKLHLCTVNSTTASTIQDIRRVMPEMDQRRVFHVK